MLRDHTSDAPADALSMHLSMYLSMPPHRDGSDDLQCPFFRTLLEGKRTWHSSRFELLVAPKWMWFDAVTGSVWKAGQAQRLRVHLPQRLVEYERHAVSQSRDRQLRIDFHKFLHKVGRFLSIA